MNSGQIIKGAVAAAAMAAWAAFASLGGAPATAAEPYPNRAVHIIDAFPPGGSTDYLARQIGARTGNDWKVPIVVDNRGGAAGQIGTGTVARAEPDGYTLLIIPNELWSVAPVLYGKRLPYDTHKQLMQLSPVAQVPIVVAVNPALPVSNIEELIAYAKKHPGQVSYGTAGVGSIHHLAAALFENKAGVSFMHVPYQGTAPAVNGLLGNQVQVVFSPISSVLSYIQAGKLKALAVAGSTRAQALPDVPTVAESGLPGYDATFRVSLLAPRGIPEEVRRKWFEQVRNVTGSDEIRKAWATQGIEPDQIDYDAWLQRFDRETKQWQAVIEQANIHVE
jgi:tripartite-type tricarboxylate transporter receptor subunit TctC